MMPEQSNQTQFPNASASNRVQGGHAAVGHRVVHVAVPEMVFNHAKAQAYLSNLEWTPFITRLLSESKPYDNSDSNN